MKLLTLAASDVVSLTNGFNLVAELEAFAKLVAVCGQFAKVPYVLVVSAIGRTPDTGPNDVEGQFIVLRFGSDTQGQGSCGEDSSEKHVVD